MEPSGNHESQSPKVSLRDRVQRLRLADGMEAGRGGSRAWIPWTLCTVLALICVALALRLRVPAADAKDPKATPKENVAAAGDVVLESKGYIIPAHQIQVSPKVGGMVIQLNIEEGRKVKEGEVLAVLEKTNYEAAVNHAKAALIAAEERYREQKNGPREEEIEAAKAAFEEAKTQRDQLYLDWKRNINLKTGNALAQRDYELAESSYKSQERRVRKLDQDYRLLINGYRKERIEAARADVDQARADLVTAQWNLDNCTVIAPVSGTILTKKAEKGNIVNPIAFNVAASLCDMADLSDLEVDMSIQERDIAAVKQGQRCRVRPEAFPDRTYQGVVSRLMPIADRAKGAIPVRVKLVDIPKSEEGVYLKPEMGVIVSFLKE
jgi:multidrug resistance efflux pump